MYRDWKIAGDSDWLARLWPDVKKSLAFAWSPANPDRWDRDRDGVLEGRQHHTLDTELFGPNSWLTGFYLAALATAEMAEHLGDADAEAEYRALFRSRKRWVDAHLFNGEYYHQLIDLTDKRTLERLIEADATVVDGGTGRTAARRDWDEYRDAASGQINYQVAEGCGIDQVAAQWHANIAGEIGRAAIWDDPIPECYYQKALHRLQSKGGYDAYVMMSLLELWASTGYLANYVTQTSIAHLPKDKLEIVPVPVPARHEQWAIAEALSDVDRLLETLD